MAAQVLSTGCVQQQPGLMDSPPGLRSKPPGPSGRAAGAPSRRPGFAVRSLNFDTSSPASGYSWSSTAAPHTATTLTPSSSSLASTVSSSPQALTPDSGISGTAFGSMTKTPESDYSLSAALTPHSALSSSSSFSGVGGGVCSNHHGGGGGTASGTAGCNGSGGRRKRKTVTIDESQTSIVMISPDDLFRTYSGMISTFEEHQDQTGETDKYRGGEGNGENAQDVCRYRVYGDEKEEAQAEEQEGKAADDDDHYGDEDEGHFSYPGEQCPEMPFGSGLHDSLTSGHSGRFVLDTETGWPLKRSESLESRDNPFLPGGELSKEAEDLLSRATIVRDHFYLNEEERRVLIEQQKQELQQQQKRTSKHVQIVDHQDGGHDVTSDSTQPQAVEERVCVAAAANSVSAMPTTSNGDGGASHLENGRRAGEPGTITTAGAADVGVTIPGNDGEALPPGTQGAGAPNSHASSPGPEGLSVQDSDKKKVRNKCCSVM